VLGFYLNLTPTEKGREGIPPAREMRSKEIPYSAIFACLMLRTICPGLHRLVAGLSTLADTAIAAPIGSPGLALLV
jgi:hypothetical protein